MKKFLSLALCLMMLFAQIMGSASVSGLGVVWADDGDSGSAFTDDTGSGTTGTGDDNPVTPPSKPGSPSIEEVTASDGQVLLRWSPPGDSVVTGYEVSCNSGNWVDVGDRTSYTFESLTNGISYSFEVRAVNSGGESGAVGASATPTAPVTKPDAPSNLTAIAGDGRVELNWSSVGNGGDPNMRYKITWNGGGSGDTTGITYLCTGLINDTEYIFSVRASNTAGESETITVRATPAAPVVPIVTTPGTPQSFAATAGDKQVVLSWLAPSSDGGDSNIKYEVSSDDGKNWITATGSTSHTFTGLTNGTEYHFKVRAVNSAGNGNAATATATPAATVDVPSVPQSFSATPGDKQVVLKWSAPSSTGGSSITKYEVSSDNGSKWVTASSSTSHTFTDLTNGTSYTFKVRAVNSAGSGAEASATATPTASNLPGEPRYFTATPGNRQVELKWSAPSSNGGSSIIRYEVSSNDGGKWVTAASSDSHTFTGLTNGTSYTFKVRAVNSNGSGAEVSVTATPTSSNLPSEPQNLVASPGVRKVELTWTAPSSYGGSSIIRYEVSRDGGSSWIETGSSTSYTFSDLTSGTSYTFRVRAVNSTGSGTEASVSATPLADNVPSEPQSLTATPGNGKVELKWSAPSSTGGSTITKYEVSSNNGSTWVTAGSTTSHTFTGLTNGTSYTFKVRAVNKNGNGAQAAISATPIAVPSVPQSFTATPGDKQMELKWTAPSSTGGSTITKYEVSSNNGSTWVTASSSTSHTFTGLTNGTSYTFKVRAVNNNGYGDEASVTATPNPVSLPGVPRNFTANPGNGKVELKWTAPSSTGNSSITKYEVSSDNGKNWVTASSTTSHTFTGLTNGTSYTFKVRAVNSGGGGEEASVTATPVALLGVPQGFTATPGDRQVELKWTAPSGSSSSAITKYEVSSNNGSTWVTASSTTSHIFTGLSNGTSYTFKVRAVNSSGNGEEATATATPSSGGSSNANQPSGKENAATVKLNGQEVSADLDASGTLILNYTEADIARYSGGASGVFSITVSKQNSVALNIPIPALDKKALLLSSDFGEVNIPNATLQVFREQYGDTLRLMIQKSSFKITLLNANGREIAYDNPTHPVVISLPYTVSGAENPNAIVAVKIVSGQNTILPYAVYGNGTVSFETGATGTYDLIYNARNFSDTASHWAQSSIAFVTAREIFSGTSADRFSPDSPMTRAMFATVLARLDGADLSVYTTSRFNDVTTDQWYAASVEWAADKRIVNGTGSGDFDPNANITREQMAVMLNNYINYKSYQLSVTATNTETAFADGDRISGWADESVQTIRRAGIIGGKPGNLFDPQGVATRGEVAAIFTRFVEMRAK